MAETPLNLDQLPPIALDNLTSVTAAGKDAFLAAQSSGSASAANRLATINDVLALADGGVYSRVGLFGNNGFATGLDCWENEAPFPLGAWPLTETEKVRVMRAFAGPTGTDMSCGCPGLGIEILKGFEGCSFDVIAQRRDFKCADLLICDDEFTLELTAYVWGASTTETVRPYAKLQLFNEGVYLGEQKHYLTNDPVSAGAGGDPTKISALVNIAIGCCADEVRAVLGFETDSDQTFSDDLYLFVQSFQMVGRLGAVFGPLAREAFDSPVLNLITPEGVVHFDRARNQQTTVIERAEEAPGWSWDAGAKIAGNWTPVEIHSNQVRRTRLQRIGAGIEVQTTDSYLPGWSPNGLQWAIIDSPLHEAAMPADTFDLDYRLAINPKAETGFVNVILKYRRNAVAINAAWSDAATVAIPAGGAGTIPVDLTTLTGGPDGQWEFAIFVDDGGDGFWSNAIRVYRNQAANPDFDERPVRFVNTADPRATGGYGLRVSRSLDRLRNRLFRPFVGFFDLSQNNEATHFRITLECNINEGAAGYPAAQFGPLGQGYDVDLVADGPLVMMTDANGQSRVVGVIRHTDDNPLIPDINLQDCGVFYDDGVNRSLIVPIAWLTGQPVATSNSNALVPFDYSRVASLEIVCAASQMQVRALTIAMGTGDDGLGGFNTLVKTEEVDLTDDYTAADVDARWTQAGPALWLRHYDDTRLYWGEYQSDDLNFEDEAEWAPRMTLVSRRALNNMDTSFGGCPIDEMEVPANYIALHRTNNFEWDVSSTNRDVFYSVIRRVFDDDGYRDISAACVVDDGSKRRFLFPDIQFTAAAPDDHLYQFQATLVDDRGNKLVGSWSPVVSPRNAAVTCRTERHADTDEFDYANGAFAVDTDTLYAAQIEDFNFRRVSELIVRALGVRPQNHDNVSLWETYSAVGAPQPTQAVSFAAGSFQVQLVPVGWHEGQLIANVHVFPYDEPFGGAGTLNQLDLNFQLTQGFVTDRIVWGAWTVDAESGFESADYTIELSTGGHTNGNNVVMTVLIGGLNATVRNGSEPLPLALTVSDCTFFAETEREYNILLAADELAAVLDQPATDKPCVALGRFVVQGPGGSIILDDLSQYDLSDDPAGAQMCFRRQWAELTESNTLAHFDYAAYSASADFAGSRGLRIINYDGGLLLLADEAADATMELAQWELLEMEFDGHPQMHKTGSALTLATGSGSVKPGWLTMYKLAPLVNFAWQNSDPVTGDPIDHDVLAVIDLDWGVLAGRTRGWHQGGADPANRRVWISKRELQEIGVFLADARFADLPDDTVITLKRAGFFFEGYTNQINNLDFDEMAFTLLGNDPPNVAGYGDQRLDNDTTGASDATIRAAFTLTSTTQFGVNLSSEGALLARLVPLFNRALRLTGPTTASVLGKTNEITYDNISGVVTVATADMVAGIGFINPEGAALAGFSSVTVTVDNVVGPTQRFAFVVARTNYGRQLISNQQAVPASGAIVFNQFTTGEALTYTYEPSAWEAGRVYRDASSEGAYTTEFQGNWADVGAERVTAVEMYVVFPQRSADGTAASFDVTLVVANNLVSPGYYSAAATDPMFNGYDPEGAGRNVWMPGSDRSACRIHEASVNVRSNRAAVFMHYRPNRYGRQDNDRLAQPAAADLATLNKLVMNIRAFGPHYLMVVGIENDGTDWTVIDADNAAARLVVPESEQMRAYARLDTAGAIDHDDSTPLDWFEFNKVLEATSFDDDVEEFLLIFVPLHSFQGPSVDVDDLALRDNANALLFGETFDYRSQTDLLRQWDAEFTPGQDKLSQAAATPHPHLFFDPFQQVTDGARRAYRHDVCGGFHPHNVLETGDALDGCKLPLVFASEPEHVKYYDDAHYADGGRGAVVVPSLAGNEAVDEASAQTGAIYFHDAGVRGVNNRLMAYLYQRHTGCCLGVPIRTRTVEFVAPECNCGGGPAGLVGITNFITHPKLPQLITDDNFVIAGFPSGVRRDDYGASLCFEYRRDDGMGGFEWVAFDSTTPQRVFYAGGGRPDPAGPFPGDNLYVTVWAGPNSAATSSRMAFVAADAELREVREYTFDCGVHDVSGFAIGFPVWVRNSCSPDGCKYDLCDVRSSTDANVRGVYGVVTAVDVLNSTITVQFNDPVEATFRVNQFAEIVVSPEGAMGFYLEFTPDFINEVTDFDPNATLVRWGFRYWETTEPLGECGCGDGGGLVCEADGQTQFFGLIGDDTNQPVHPRDFFGSFNAPAPHALLNADALPGQTYIEVCNPERFEDDAPIAVVDNTWVNGFVARVIGRDVLRKRLYLDRALPLASESLCGWDPTPFDGFTTARAAIVYRLADFLPIRTLSISDFLDPRAMPVRGQVHVDMAGGRFTFHPNESGYDYWVRYYDANQQLPLPERGGVYRLVGIDACGRRTAASEHITVFGTNRQQQFFTDRGYKVEGGLILPIEPPYPNPPQPPAAGNPFGADQFEGTTSQPGGAISVNYQALFFDPPPAGPMAGDADDINPQVNATYKMGSGRTDDGPVYDLRLYLVKETRYASRAGVTRELVTPTGTLSYTFTVDGDQVEITGNAGAGLQLQFVDPGDGGPYFADCQVKFKGTGPTTIQLAKVGGSTATEGPDAMSIGFLVVDPVFSYRVFAWNSIDQPEDGLSLIDGDNDVRIGVGRKIAGGLHAGPVNEWFDQLMAPDGDLGPFDVTITGTVDATYDGGAVTLLDGTTYITLTGGSFTINADGDGVIRLANGPALPEPFAQAGDPLETASIPFSGGVGA